MSCLWFVRRILMIAPGKRLHHLNWTWVYMNILFCFIHIYIIWINYIYVFEYSYYASTVFGNTWKHPNQGSEELAVAYCIYGSYVINIFDLEARSSLARAWTPSKHAVNLPEWSPIAKLTEAHIFPLLKANESTKWNTGQLGNTNATRGLWPRVSWYIWDSMYPRFMQYPQYSESGLRPQCLARQQRPSTLRCDSHPYRPYHNVAARCCNQGWDFPSNCQLLNGKTCSPVAVQLPSFSSCEAHFAICSVYSYSR